MKIGVTGGSGFIGSHIVDKLIEEKQEVTIIDILPPHRFDVEFFKTNIINFEELYTPLKDLDALFHLAAISNVNKYAKKPVFSTNLNIIGTVNLLEACRLYDIDRFIFASTVWIYGACSNSIVDEDASISLKGAGHPYTSSKIASELLVQDYWSLYGNKFTILRYGIPYGERARKGTVIPIFVERALSNKAITIYGDGESNARNFIYVKDLAEGNVRALSPKGENQIFNLDGSEEITIKHIADTITDILGHEISIEYKEPRPGDYTNRKVLIEKAKSELNWEPSTSFREGMKHYIDWVIQHQKPPLQ